MLECGWYDPKGECIPCGFQCHEMFANVLCQGESFELEAETFSTTLILHNYIEVCYLEEEEKTWKYIFVRISKVENLKKIQDEFFDINDEDRIVVILRDRLNENQLSGFSIKEWKESGETLIDFVRSLSWV